MRAAVFQGPRRPLEIEEVAKPTPGPGEVVIKIAGAGVCHSDVLKLQRGHFANAIGQRTDIFGHENGGWVESVGAGVTSAAEGDPVIVYTSPGCGTCTYCIRGLEQFCADKSRWNGIGGVGGGFAEYMLVRTERALVKLKTLDPAKAATLTDAGFTSYSAVHRAIPYFDAEHPVLVIGAGGLGSYAIKYLKVLSGSPIVVVERGEVKRKQAEAHGASWTFDGRDPEVAQQIRDLTDGRGVCASFDFVGSDETLALCIGVTRAAGKVTQVGLAGGKAVINAAQTFNFGQVFEPHLSGSLKDLRDAVSLVERGRVDLIPVEFAPLGRINDVLAGLEAGRYPGRAVIDPSLVA